MPARRLNTIHKRECAMKRVDAKQQLGALMVAMGITVSIVWALSSYAYGEKPSGGFSPTANRIVQARACS